MTQARNVLCFSTRLGEELKDNSGTSQPFFLLSVRADDGINKPVRAMYVNAMSQCQLYHFSIENYIDVSLS